MATRLIETIAALGPASGSEPAIRNLVAKGVNIFKLNLSRGIYETVQQWIQWVCEVENERYTFIGVLLDLQDPKLRVGQFELD
ncbi:MAG: pyruvate kinase [Nitrospinaceae bacterium]